MMLLSPRRSFLIFWVRLFVRYEILPLFFVVQKKKAGGQNERHDKTHTYTHTQTIPHAHKRLCSSVTLTHYLAME